MFSVFVDTMFSVELEKNTWKTKDLFSEQRLNWKLFTFEHFSLKSLSNQTNQNFVHRVFYSDSLPKSFKHKLLSLSSTAKFINVPSKIQASQLSHIIRLQAPSLSINLDDDDVLHPNFIDCLLKECFKESVIFTNPVGIYAKYTENKQLVACDKSIYPCINLGLAFLNFDISKNGAIWTTGNHCNLTSRGFTIKEWHLPNKEFSWIRCIGPNEICNDGNAKVNELNDECKKKVLTLLCALE